MKTHVSEALLLKLIKESGSLEIWTNKDPKTYHAGKILIGQEGQRDAKTIERFIELGFLKTLSIATNCHLYQLTPDGEAYLKTVGF